MLINERYGRANRPAFMLVDFCAMLISLNTAYYLNYNTLEINSERGRFIVIISFVNIVITSAVSPCSDLFHTTYYKEIGRHFGIVIANALLAALVLCFFKAEAEFPREVVIETYILYFFIGAGFKYAWKKCLLSQKSPSQSFYFFLKRIFDIACSAAGLIFLMPVSAVVKIAYLLSGDTAKVFYRQKRVGLNGREINIWKYRTMVPEADTILKDLLKDERYRTEWENNQKLNDDPRVTMVGKVLRRTSVDELPQVINVLKGEMSIVGPRPLVEGELSAHCGLKLYESVKPGITGWWGCNGRSNIDYRERLDLEYYYVKNCSLYLDVLCIIRTLFAVFKKDGAL